MGVETLVLEQGKKYHGHEMIGYANSERLHDVNMAIEIIPLIIILGWLYIWFNVLGLLLRIVRSD